MAETAKKSFYDKVKAFLGCGDERKVNRFYDKFIKDNGEQVRLREKDNSDDVERILEIDEELTESLFKIDLKSIDTIADTNTYVEKYRNDALKIIKRKAELQKKIETREKEIKEFQKLNELVKRNPVVKD